MSSFEDIQRAKSLIASNNRPEARQVLSALVKTEPSNAQGWYLMSFVVDEKDQAIYCLDRAVKIDPLNQEFNQRLRQFQAQNKPAAPVQQAPRQNPGLFVTNQKEWYREPLFKFFAFLFFTPGWVLIMLTDPEESSMNKMGAVAFQLFLCVMASWYFLSN